MGKKSIWYVGITESGKADIDRNPVEGPYLFAFGPYPAKTAEKWCRAWNTHLAEHTLTMIHKRPVKEETLELHIDGLTN